MEKAFGREGFRKQAKGEMDKMRSSSNSTQSLTAATQALAMALALAPAQQVSGKRQVAQGRTTPKPRQPRIRLKLLWIRESVAAAREALKGPTAELEKAKRNFDSSTQDASAGKPS